MRNTLFLCLTVLILLSSCFKKKDTHKNEVTENPTPEVLNKSETYVSDISMKRYKGDVITELFKEAIEKDADLKAFTDRIEFANGWKTDSLEAYHKYTSTNNDYWASSRYLFEQIKDSTLKKEYMKLFDNLKTKQQQLTAENDTAVSVLNKKQQLFNDYYILVKLMVTQQMMLNYQQNELPDVEPIKRVIEEYDSLMLISKSLLKKK